MLSSWVSSIYLNCWNKCKIANSPAASSLLGPQSASQSYVQYIWPLYSIIYFRNLPPARPQLLPPAREHTPDILFQRSSWSQGSSLKYRPEILPTVSTILNIYTLQLHSFFCLCWSSPINSIPLSLLISQDRKASLGLAAVCHSLSYLIFRPLAHRRFS